MFLPLLHYFLLQNCKQVCESLALTTLLCLILNPLHKIDVVVIIVAEIVDVVLKVIITVSQKVVVWALLPELLLHFELERRDIAWGLWSTRS